MKNTVAQNESFGTKWEELQKRLTAVLSAAHTSDGQEKYSKAVREAIETLTGMERLQTEVAKQVDDKYDGLKGRLVSLLGGRKSVVVKLGDLDPEFVKEISGAKFRLKLSSQDGMVLSFNNSLAAVKVSAI
jgi:uncharacterized membrane protein (UPF0127 family)